MKRLTIITSVLFLVCLASAKETFEISWSDTMTESAVEAYGKCQTLGFTNVRFEDFKVVEDTTHATAICQDDEELSEQISESGEN